MSSTKTGPLIKSIETDDDRLQFHITQNKVSEAMEIFRSLRVPPSTETKQRLAVLLSKHEVKHVKRGYEILKDLYTSKGFEPDRYSPVAFIFVIDGCLRTGLTAEALETYYEAHNLSVTLDLPAFNSVIQAFLDQNSTDEAISVVETLFSQYSISPSSDTFMPLIRSLVAESRYQKAIHVLQQIRQHKIPLPLDVYHEMTDLYNDLPEEMKKTERDLQSFIAYVDAACEDDHGEMLDDVIMELDLDDDEA